MTRNGFIPRSGLVTVEDDDRLIPTAARAYTAMRDAAARAGRSFRIAEPAGAYRSYATQLDMHRHPERYNLNPKSMAKLAPAGASGHGLGNCIDVVGDLAWVIQNGARFGWRRPLSNDPNHFQHDGVTAATPPPQTKDTDMQELFHLEGSSPTLYALAGASPGTPANWRETRGEALATTWAQRYGNSILLSVGTWNSWKAQFLAPLKVDVDSAPIAAAPTVDHILDGLAERLQE